MDFGRMVGVWEMDIKTFAANGQVRQHLRGMWEFGSILEGRAIQDALITQPSEPEPHGGLKGSIGEYGTTVRMYDAKLDNWQVTYFGPRHSSSVAFVARRDGSSMILERREPTGEITSWAFDEIRPQHFRWRALSSNDGKHWILDQVMDGVRKR